MVAPAPQHIAPMADEAAAGLSDAQRQVLAAVGQLAAGVAHEINTPVQYVADSLHFLRECVAEMTSALRQLEALARAPEAGDGASSGALWRQTFHAAYETSDLGFLLENAPSAMERALDGIVRVGEIVGALRDLSHPGLRARAPTDLNRLVANALTVARHEFKYVADVETDFSDELPWVICHGGEIGQVVLNLITNAAHALTDTFRRTQRRGRLRVSTSLRDGFASICVEDTGDGIAPEVAPRIFEPFFTTKELGRGTGQGLALALAIAERHAGRIDFSSIRGQGATFWLRLPCTAAPCEKGA